MHYPINLVWSPSAGVAVPDGKVHQYIAELIQAAEHAHVSALVGNEIIFTAMRHAVAHGKIDHKLVTFTAIARGATYIIALSPVGVMMGNIPVEFCNENTQMCYDLIGKQAEAYKAKRATLEAALTPT